jgi:uncharacterized membrane protein (DUF485 family)
MRVPIEFRISVSYLLMMDVGQNSAYRMSFDFLFVEIPAALSERKNQNMAGLGHGPAEAEAEDPRDMERNARNGMVLFVVYLVFYGGFVGLNAFYPKQMEATPLWGINLAILYGAALIMLAMILALVYSWLCRGGQHAARQPDA